MRVLGVDIGGTRIKAALIQDRQVVVRRTVATDPRPEAVVQQIVRWSREFAPLAGIGVGVPGMVDEHGVVRFPPNLPAFHGFPLQEALQEATGLVVRVENDADVYALGEWRYGAARGSRFALVVTLGTGVGTGMIVDGQILRGFQGSGGEGGHIIVDPEGPTCHCGNRGCLEAYVGEVHFVEHARRYLKSRGVALPENLTARWLADQARNGDPLSQELWHSFGRYLGLGLVTLVHVLGPEVVVLGGGLAGAYDLFEASLLGAFRRRLMGSHLRTVAIKPGELGDLAGPLGALALLEPAVFP